jgi:hypothetical protein
VTLLDAVASRLEALKIPYCAIGASALAAHGVSRATQDIDLLTVDMAALEARSWEELPPGVTHEVRRGDAMDPLAGVVRLQRPGETDVDVVVGKHRWQSGVIDRSVPTIIEGRGLPVAGAPDLVLLKLFAGGPQDAWDIGELLRDADTTLVADVERHLGELPTSAQQLWRRLRTKR